MLNNGLGILLCILLRPIYENIRKNEKIKDITRVLAEDATGVICTWISRFETHLSSNTVLKQGRDYVQNGKTNTAS